MTNSTDGPAAADPPPDTPHFAHTDPTGHRLYACPATYQGQPGVWIRANGVTLTGPVLTELMAALPLIAADAQAFGDDPGPSPA